MMGGGGGSTFGTSNPADLQRQLREEELEAAEAEFGPRLAEMLNGYLARVNDRDIAMVDERLKSIKAALGDAIEGTIDLRFGGSVAKHTYVDGLSDVDSLLVIRVPEGQKMLPRDLIRMVAKELTSKLGGEAQVSYGRLAVTLTYKDGPEIQLVPAVREGSRLAVPSRTENKWSRINPEKFTRGLTKRNDECNGKLVPAIKLAKAINDQLPETQQLSGYHIESLAISAFRNYSGIRTLPKMLLHFFREIPSLVKRPIRDRTGQSVHVDEYLGRAGSARRAEAAHLFARIGKRMENALAARSLDQWRRLIDG